MADTETEVIQILPVLPLKNTILGNLGKAMIWGGILAVLSALLWVPRNFPEFHPGFFTNNLGWKTVIGIFIWHLVYAVHLGALYNPLSETETVSGAARTAP